VYGTAPSSPYQRAERCGRVTAGDEEPETKLLASAFQSELEKAGSICERSFLEEHLTRGGADGRERRRAFRSVFVTPFNSNEVEGNLKKSAIILVLLLLLENIYLNIIPILKYDRRSGTTREHPLVDSTCNN
jgi:hypothetical protein